jgi:HD-like signal output (HDOD) protein
MGIVDMSQSFLVAQLKVDFLRGRIETIGDVRQGRYIEWLQRILIAWNLDADILEIRRFCQKMLIGGQGERLHEMGRYTVDEDFEAQRLDKQNRSLACVDGRKLRLRARNSAEHNSDRTDKTSRASPKARAKH